MSFSSLFLSHFKLEWATSIILFKEDFSEEEKQEIYQAAKAVIVDDEFDDMEDYEDIWFWFLHSYFIEYYKREGLNSFVENQEFKSYISLVESPKRRTTVDGVLKYLPILKKGNVEISSDPKINIEFEWVDKKKTQVKFSEIIKRIKNLFPKLKLREEIKVCILIDELELRKINKKQYKRDSELIRDLIISIDRFNRICKNCNFNIAVVAAVRSEVLNSVYSSGKEIDKLISDFGYPIIWNIPGANDGNHPLLEIIEKRLKKYTKDDDVWSTLFVESVQGLPIKKYILNYSWYRPRDIVRILMLVQELTPYEVTFSHKGFDGIRTKYATESWKELSEEIVTKYNLEQLKSIKKIFNGIRNPFNKDIIKCRYENLPIENKSYFNEDFNTDSLLEDLFTIGIIGNNYFENGEWRIRFAFRGNDDLFLDKDMILHKGIRPYFSSF